MENIIRIAFRNVKLFAITILLCAGLISCSDKPTQTADGTDRTVLWQQDIDFLSSQLKLKQIDLPVLISEQKLNNELTRLKGEVSALQDYEIYLRLQQIIASLHVAHTLAAPSASNKYHFLPIYASLFSDSLYIIMTDELNTNLLGKKIISIGKKSIQTVIDSLKTIISYENKYWLNDNIPPAVCFAEALKYFGFTNSLTEVSLEVENGETVILKTLEQYPQSSTTGFKSILNGKTLPLYMQNPSGNYWYTYITTNKIIYLKYNVCANMGNYPFANMVNDIVSFMSNHETEKFVIDLRNNGGGNSSVIEPLSVLQNSPLNSTGKLFVIIGNHTFSSALLNAISFKQNSNCILVGSPTGGKPNSYGEVLTFTLPNSHIAVQYSTVFFTTVSGNPESLLPDYLVEATFKDYINCNDPVLEFIYSYK